MKYLQWNDVWDLLQNPLRQATGWWSKIGHALIAWKSGGWQFTISFSIFLHMSESFHNRNILNNLWWLPILLCMISKTLHGLTLYKPCLLPSSQQLPLLQPHWPCTSLTCCQTYFCHRAFVSAVPAPTQISSPFSSLPKCYLIREVSPDLPTERKQSPFSITLCSLSCQYLTLNDLFAYSLWNISSMKAKLLLFSTGSWLTELGLVQSEWNNIHLNIFIWILHYQEFFIKRMPEILISRIIKWYLSNPES